MLRPRFQARPALAGRGVCRWPDGSARALHCRRTRARRRPVHAASLRRAGREGAAADLRTHKGRACDQKGQGSKLGNPTNIREAGNLGRTTAMAGANDHARTLLPLLRSLRAEGAITIGAIMRSLNERKVPTARGSRWHVSSVANLLARAQSLEAVR